MAGVSKDAGLACSEAAQTLSLDLNQARGVFETCGLGFEVFGSADPRIPNRRVAGALGIFAVPRGQLAQPLDVMRQNPLHHKSSARKLRGNG